jgi:hypothetical protein
MSRQFGGHSLAKGREDTDNFRITLILAEGRLGIRL